MSHTCPDLDSWVAEDDIPVIYVAKYREYGIRVLDGGSSYIVLRHCPSCGQELPHSLRDAWFERVAELGLDPLDDALPVELESDKWWRDLGL
jgi:hypothetical protein